jgi:hypothetical protein
MRYRGVVVDWLLLRSLSIEGRRTPLLGRFHGGGTLSSGTLSRDMFLRNVGYN